MLGIRMRFYRSTYQLIGLAVNPHPYLKHILGDSVMPCIFCLMPLADHHDDRFVKRNVKIPRPRHEIKAMSPGGIGQIIVPLQRTV